MHPCVEAAVWSYLGKPSHEGNVKYMYLDSKGWVSIGVGMKIDPLSSHLSSLKQSYFVVKKGATNTQGKTFQQLLQADYATVRGMRGLIGVTPKKALPKYAAATNLRITPQGLKAYFMAKARGYERRLKTMGRAYFKDFDKWPADAQFGIMNMCWAFNVGGLLTKFPSFCKACRDMKFDVAAKECRYNWDKRRKRFDSYSSKLRNATNRQLFLNAADVVAKKKPINVLVYQVT